jgi:hypothetical protein
MPIVHKRLDLADGPAEKLGIFGIGAVFHAIQYIARA